MLRNRSIALIGLIVVLVPSCQKEDSNIEVLHIPTTPAPNSRTVNETLLLQLVNAVRQAGCTCGSSVMPPVAAVSWNEQLETAALNHSLDMDTNEYFSHTGLNGSTAGERIAASGYKWRAYGENIAKGYMSEQTVMEGWIKSEGHCKNIMSSSVREMGVARSGNYWTQELGSR